jgi:hypothetical protein
MRKKVRLREETIEVLVGDEAVKLNAVADAEVSVPSPEAWG